MTGDLDRLLTAIGCFFFICLAAFLLSALGTWLAHRRDGKP